MLTATTKKYSWEHSRRNHIEDYAHKPTHHPTHDTIYNVYQDSEQNRKQNLEEHTLTNKEKPTPKFSEGGNFPRVEFSGGGGSVLGRIFRLPVLIYPIYNFCIMVLDLKLIKVLLVTKISDHPRFLVSLSPNLQENSTRTSFKPQGDHN